MFSQDLEPGFPGLWVAPSSNLPRKQQLGVTLSFSRPSEGPPKHTTFALPIQISSQGQTEHNSQLPFLKSISVSHCRQNKIQAPGLRDHPSHPYQLPEATRLCSTSGTCYPLPYSTPSPASVRMGLRPPPQFLPRAARKSTGRFVSFQELLLTLVYV